jgi:hypothetical protein
MPNDIAIGTTNLSVGGAPKLNKPAYLITLVDLEYSAKNVTKVVSYFIAMDRPGLENGFVLVKGVHVKESLEEDEIVKRFADILTNAPKDSVVEMMFPNQRIHGIRSLVFNAVKPIMINR